MSCLGRCSDQADATAPLGDATDTPDGVWPDNRLPSSTAESGGGTKVLSDSLMSDGLLDWFGGGAGVADGREKGQRESEADKETPLAMSATSDDMFSLSGDMDAIFQEALALSEKFANLAKQDEEDPPVRDSPCSPQFPDHSSHLVTAAEKLPASASATAAADGAADYAALCERASAALRQLELQTQEEVECLQFEAMERSLAEVTPSPSPPPRCRPQLTPWPDRPSASGTFKVTKKRTPDSRSQLCQPQADVKNRAIGGAERKQEALQYAAASPGLNRTFNREHRRRPPEGYSPDTGANDVQIREDAYNIPSPNGTHSASCRNQKLLLNQTFDGTVPDDVFGGVVLNQTLEGSALNQLLEGAAQNLNIDGEPLNRTFEGNAMNQASDKVALNQTFDGVALNQTVGEAAMKRKLSEAVLNQTFDRVALNETLDGAAYSQVIDRATPLSSCHRRPVVRRQTLERTPLNQTFDRRHHARSPDIEGWALSPEPVVDGCEEAVSGAVSAVPCRLDVAAAALDTTFQNVGLAGSRRPRSSGLVLPQRNSSSSRRPMPPAPHPTSRQSPQPAAQKPPPTPPPVEACPEPDTILSIGHEDATPLGQHLPVNLEQETETTPDGLPGAVASLRRPPGPLTSTPQRPLQPAAGSWSPAPLPLAECRLPAAPDGHCTSPPPPVMQQLRRPQQPVRPAVHAGANGLLRPSHAATPRNGLVRPAAAVARTSGLAAPRAAGLARPTRPAVLGTGLRPAKATAGYGARPTVAGLGPGPRLPSALPGPGLRRPSAALGSVLRPALGPAGTGPRPVAGCGVRAAGPGLRQPTVSRLRIPAAAALPRAAAPSSAPAVRGTGLPAPTRRSGIPGVVRSRLPAPAHKR